MSKRPPALLPIFRSESQLRLLGIIYVHAGREFSISDLSRQTAIPQQTVSREVERLARAGLLTSRGLGRLRLVGANPDSPYFPELRGLLFKAVGPATAVEEKFRTVKGIEEAFIFGSWARRYTGEVGPPPADLDVVVIGSASPDEVALASQSVERRLGLEVNPIVLSRREWETQSSGFVRQVRKGPLVPVINPTR